MTKKLWEKIGGTAFNFKFIVFNSKLRFENKIIINEFLV